MTADCPNLSAFVDGGLPLEDQDGFRAHLASCEVCWVRLHELLQVDVLGRMAFAEEAEVREAASAPWPQPPTATVMEAPPPLRHPIWTRVGGPALLLVAAAVWTLRIPRDAPASWLTPGPTRPLEARLTYAALDTYRAHVPMRGQPSVAAPLPLRELARLEERQDWQGLAAAYLYAGDPRQALATLRAAPASANRDSDRAVATALGRVGPPEQASLDEALALVGRQLKRGEVPERCVLAVSVQHERTVAVALGPTGTVRGHYAPGRTAPLGQDASGLVPAPLQDALRGCARVEVLAPPPVHGLPGLLPLDIAWSYRMGPAATEGLAPRKGTHLVVSGVDTPVALGLPRLPPMPPTVADPLRVTLEGARATPSRVLEAMGSATEVELHAHGVFSPELSDASLLMLAPERDGRYVLTASQVRARRLSGAPLVFLAACSAARTAPFPHESFSLPAAFLDAGARAVLAATVDIPDSAGRFFNAVRERIRAGAPPAVALRDERLRWLEAAPGDRWVHDVLLFE